MPRKHTQTRIVILVGPPGSGKGTQAAFLSAELGIPAVSTGELLRRECQSGSGLGRMVASVLASGQLVSDELMNQVVSSRMRECDCERGCILDGYPRTVSQARFLDGLLTGARKRRPLIFDFEISCDEIVARLGWRRQCGECGRIFRVAPDAESAAMVCDRDGSPLVQRADDNPETVRKRLRLYEGNAEELRHYYQNHEYHRIYAARPAVEICEELLSVLAASWPIGVLPRTAALSAQAGLRA
jgi:adenylate kinase